MKSDQGSKFETSGPETTACKVGDESRRRAWKTPAVQRLAVSAAEFGGGTHADSEGTS